MEEEVVLFVVFPAGGKGWVSCFEWAEDPGLGHVCSKDKSVERG